MARVEATVRRVAVVPAAPSRWAIWAAHLVPLCAVPSGVWRIAMGVGVPVGYSAERMSAEGYPGWGTIYVIVLTVLVEALTLLTIGLVRPWGDVVPRWLPMIGGARVRPRIVTAVAGGAAVLLTGIMLSQLIVWQIIDESALDDGDLVGTAPPGDGDVLCPASRLGPVARRRHLRLPPASPTWRALTEATDSCWAPQPT